MNTTHDAHDVAVAYRDTLTARIAETAAEIADLSASDLHRSVAARVLASLATQLSDSLTDYEHFATLKMPAVRSGLISSAQLMATIPDAYGRISPFAVYVQTATGSYVSRNLSLLDAVKMANAEIVRDGEHRVSVSFDTCG